MLSRSSLNKLNLNKFIKRTIHLSSFQLARSIDDGGGESDSEKWLRYASDTENALSGNISAFEDEEGNLIRPTGELSKAMALRKLKKKTIYERVKFFIVIYS